MLKTNAVFVDPRRKDDTHTSENKEAYPSVTDVSGSNSEFDYTDQYWSIHQVLLFKYMSDNVLAFNSQQDHPGY